MNEEIKCPWCGDKIIPETKILKGKINEVVERSCKRCGKVIAAYQKGERFLDLIRERVMSFKD